MFPQFAIEDPAALSDEALGDALVELHRVEACLAAAKARVASEFDARRELAAPDDVESDAASDESLRRAHLSEGLRGTGILDAQLTPVGRSIVSNALEAIDRELFEADWADARARLGDTATLSDLARTPAQRRHDALVEMARRAMTAPAGGRPPRPLVSVLVGYETFAGRICELADGTALTPGQVAALLDDAVIERVVYDGPSRIIDISHTRPFTGALRRAIEIRDRHCTHTGCYTPANRCHIDHTHDHALDGPTTQDNGTTLCPFHHRWRHRNDPTARHGDRVGAG